MASFVTKIVSVDLCPEQDLLSSQRTLFGECVKNPLPIDRSSTSSYIQFPQMIKTCGPIVATFEKILEHNRERDSQSRQVFCAAAASGCGKTHAAYAVGHKHFVIVVRVALHNLSYKNELSAPWRSLVSRLEECITPQMGDVRHFHQLSSHVRKKCCHEGRQMIYLLIYCYVATSLDALICSGFSDERNKELLLRFHRNGISEELVDLKYRTMLEKFRSNQAFVDENKISQFMRETNSRFDQNLIICFDEIQVLSEYFPDTFESRTKANSSSEIFETRSLLYAVGECLLNITQDANWSMYITGTSFGLTNLLSPGRALSPLRDRVLSIAPEYLFTVADMIELLDHYFYIDEEIREKAETILHQFTGRPFIFMSAVFEKLWSLASRDQPQKITKSLLEDAMKPDEVKDILKKLFHDLLWKYPKFIDDSSSSTMTLIPRLISGVLTNSPIILPSDETLAEAIRSSLIPVCSTQYGKQILISDEPLVVKAIIEYLQLLLASQFDKVMYLYLNSLKFLSKGITAEEVVSYYIVMSVLSHTGNLSLEKLFLPFFSPGTEAMLPPTLREFQCTATTLVDMSSWEQKTSFLRRFVRDDGSYDTNIVLHNLPPRAGVDIAFLVTNSMAVDPTLRCQVVTCQIKNSQSSTLTEVLRSIHPATQYLTNTQRNYILNHCVRTITNIDWTQVLAVDGSTQGAGCLVQRDHLQLAQTNPQLVRNWIRVAIFARPIDERLLSFVYSFPSSLSQRGNDSNRRRLLNNAEMSPLVALTMNSSSWLTPETRGFVTMADSVVCLPTDANIIPYLDALNL